MKVVKGVMVVIACIALALSFVAGLEDISRADEKDGKAPVAAAPQQAKSSEGARTEIDNAKMVAAARVNGVDISVYELASLMNGMLASTAQSAGQVTGSPDREGIKKAALDRLIFAELSYQKARSLGIKVGRKDVDDAISDIITKLGGPENYGKFLESENTTTQKLRANVERALVIEQIYKKEVKDKVNVPEDVVKAEYEKEKSTFFRPEDIVLTDVVISSKEPGKESYAKAEGILKKIEENGNDPSKLTSDGTFIVRSYEPKADKDKELTEAARKLNVGEISGVIKTRDGLHIIQLLQYLSPKQYTFEEMKNGIEATLRADAETKRTKEWADELRKDAKIEILK